MKSLSDYFKGTASKYLSVVDATPKSNQHEIGSNKFTAILGHPGSEKLHFNATFLYFNNDIEEPDACSGAVTYYDTRLNQPKRSAEFRLYYQSNIVTAQFQAGDFCLIAIQTNGDLLIANAPPNSDHERRLKYLFEIDGDREEWIVGTRVDSKSLDLATGSILSALGFEPIEPADLFLGKLLDKFGMAFPKTAVFSEFARETISIKPNAALTPDLALEEWMKHEELLFRTLERVIVGERLNKPFETVESFISFSLSVQNRRKSRVGHALENHLEAVFKASTITYQRGAKTEGNSKPDFLFPSAAAYHKATHGAFGLNMLAAKSTCKDRWRQILAEAEKIPHKHLFTLETAISTSQTTEMISQNVQLVVPPSVANTYLPIQRTALISLEQFVAFVRRP